MEVKLVGVPGRLVTSGIQFFSVITLVPVKREVDL